jgi:hypothetical protein
MDVKAVTCPDCGLVLTLKYRDIQPEWVYDAKEWRRRCKRCDLGGPCWCILCREARGPRKQLARAMQRAQRLQTLSATE